jgi:hypothetical protein
MSAKDVSHTKISEDNIRVRSCIFQLVNRTIPNNSSTSALGSLGLNQQDNDLLFKLPTKT